LGLDPALIPGRPLTQAVLTIGRPLTQAVLTIGRPLTQAVLTRRRNSILALWFRLDTQLGNSKLPLQLRQFFEVHVANDIHHCDLLEIRGQHG